MTNPTITAICTPAGSGALGVIRVSGSDAIAVTQKIFSKNILNAEGYSIHFGNIFYKNEIIDEVLVTVFRAPRSFTKEDVAEISCHGSPYILERVLQLLLENGAELAQAGEFTQRAFLNGAMDLAQAEAVADLIASESEAAHKVAIRQLKGGFSNELKALREQLLNFVSLIELELDFGEEDVEFADRTQLKTLIQAILAKTESLIASFRLGNAIKKGVPVTIVGRPNAGKSTLLNALLGEEKAIVSHIAGTTRDVIEDTIAIQGILFRFMDTAGLRDTDDFVEKIGVERAMEKMSEAQIILYLCSGAEGEIPDDITENDIADETIDEGEISAQKFQHLFPDAKVLLIANKSDLRTQPLNFTGKSELILLSAKEKENIQSLKQKLYEIVTGNQKLNTESTILTNVRHVEALRQAQNALLTVLQGIDSSLTGDLVSIDIRTALHHIGSITGEINTEEILGNIFGKFCIGK
ncbi:MAG: tRNA uridine-5-carboxymethylaminomethyl(34) synthesis GTPase MnmE [Bacteroidia bacterium]|nr:tRNA uridine-5-carboxymethylaminomethyl(34) synthesis GTPase MnmE [Bacteroidia bacterium]